MFKVTDASAGYDRMTVLRNIELTVKPGEIVLVLGPNGAGKTTLMRMLSGLIPVQSGELELDGVDVSSRSTEQLARIGIRHVLEGHRIFPDLTVEDNIRLGQVALPRKRRLKINDLAAQAYEMFGVLEKKRSLPASSLSGGQQQMLALVQAWSSQPKYLLCDEPSMGLAQALIPDILSFLRARADEGMGVVLVEQLVDQPLSVADRVVVLRQGRVVASGDRSDFKDRKTITDLMLAQSPAPGAGEA